jgi:hypothetical protein
MQIYSVPDGFSVKQLQTDTVVNIQAGAQIWFDKFAMVKNDPNRIWEAVQYYNGCDLSSGTARAFANDVESRVYLPRVRRIYDVLW